MPSWCAWAVTVLAAAQGSQFGVGDVEVVTATVDLDEVVSYRGAISSLQEQASSAARVPAIPVDFDLCHPRSDGVVPDPAMQPRYHDPEEEIALGVWLAFGRKACIKQACPAVCIKRLPVFISSQAPLAGSGTT